MKAQRLISAKPHRSKPEFVACPTQMPRASCPCQLGLDATTAARASPTCVSIIVRTGMMAKATEVDSHFCINRVPPLVVSDTSDAGGIISERPSPSSQLITGTNSSSFVEQDRVASSKSSFSGLTYLARPSAGLTRFGLGTDGTVSSRSARRYNARGTGDLPSHLP